MKKKRAISPPSRWNSLIGCGPMPGCGQARVLGVQVVDADGDVAVAVAQRVGLGPALVERQLDLEIGLGVAQVDEGEAVEIEPVGHLEPERRAVERDRPVELEHADHHVDGLGHARAPCWLLIRISADERVGSS